MNALVALLICGLVAAPLAAQKVEIDNDWVRVLRMKLGPHEKASLDLPLPAVGVVVSSMNINRAPRKTGDVYYFSGKKIAAENTSDQAAEQIVIELKPGAPASPPVKLDPVQLDPQHHLVMLENKRVRAIKTILEPHLKSPLHDHPHYVVVYLTVLHTTMTMADGREVDNPRQPGDVAWRDALSHVTENIGDKVAAEIQVEIK
jgi:quercetin dioxygenase-like cupin family protein